jgi:uncharacterized membrane protein
MTSAQVHSIFIHFPMVISLIAFCILGYSIIKNVDVLFKTALWLNVCAALFCLLMYFSGKGTEESIRGMEHVSENYLETHKTFAHFAFYFSVIQGLMSMGLIYLSRRSIKSLRRIYLATSFTGFILYAVTAHFGARVSHPQLRSFDKKLIDKIE